MSTSSASTRPWANVRSRVSLEDAIGKEVSGRGLAYLVREAEDETREALEPFGYYSPDIAITESAAGAALAEDAPVSVIIVVRPGEPVRIRSAQVAMLGDAEDDRYLKEEIDAFTSEGRRRTRTCEVNEAEPRPSLPAASPSAVTSTPISPRARSK